MKNKQRVEREIRESASQIGSPEVSHTILAEAAIRCVELEGENARGRININQQVDRLLQETLKKHDAAN